MGASPSEFTAKSLTSFSAQNNFALLGIGHHFLERHGKLMSFQLHLSRADPSEAGVDQRAHLMRRRQLARFQEIGEFARTLLDGSSANLLRSLLPRPVPAGVRMDSRSIGA
jgi:hypothetical protein